VSCAGATSRDLSRARSTDIPAQLAALSTATTLVTVGIGGNDHNLFTSVIVGCGSFAPLGFVTRAAPCRNAFADKFARDIAADAPTIRADLREIHRAAPNARVLLVGYPSLFPRDPVAQATCVLGGLPFSAPDIDFLDSVERSLNAMLASAASATRTIFVDTYEPSLGHDMCRLPTMRWIEPMFVVSPAAPVHPNGAGQAATARAVARHLP
jgi:lysophospholipase L1-like esterase